MKIGNFFGKRGKILEISKRILQFFENRGEIWNRGGKCIMVSEGMDAPAYLESRFYRPVMYATKSQYACIWAFVHLVTFKTFNRLLIEVSNCFQKTQKMWQSASQT